jgi:NAD(P)-dependent dehydrogenase (short-subunit alcohol dehydrogenase family)
MLASCTGMHWRKLGVMELEDRVALITGAGSGIGKAAAIRLASEGARVGVLSRTAEEVRGTAEEIRRAGGDALPLTADIADAAALKQGVDELTNRYGRLDIVVANAGINGVWAPIDELQPEEWDRTINIDLRGTFLTLHYCVPHLKRAGGGAIVITSSINGTRVFSNIGATAYSCAKAAQVAMAQMAALELAKHRIRVNAVCPGAIETEIDETTQRRKLETAKEPVEYPQGQIPLADNRPGTSQQVAELIFFLVSDRARHITGSPVWIDGGQSLLVG